MRLYMVRHAIAEERTHWNDIGKSDRLRPLTPDGIRKFKKCLSGFKKIIPAGTPIYSSQFERAKQTAMLLGGALPSSVEEIDLLNHGQDPLKLYQWVKTLKDEEDVVVIGHEPEFSFLLEFIFDKKMFGAVEFKKGGCVVIKDFFDDPRIEGIYRPRLIKEMG